MCVCIYVFIDKCVRVTNIVFPNACVFHTYMAELVTKQFAIKKDFFD